MIELSPYGEGWLAFRQGQSILDCPYGDEVDEVAFVKDGVFVLCAERWRDGWREAQL